MKAAIGLADLARLFHRLPAEHQAEHAAWLGFRAPDPPAPPPEEPPGDRPSSVLGLIGSPTASTQEATDEPETPMQFWRIEAAVESEPPSNDEVSFEPGLTWAEIASPGRRLSAVPSPPSLAPWSMLWSRLRSALHGSVASREPDVAALVRSWARGDWVGRIPRLARRSWAAAVTIWVDRSERLIPFWSDQDEVCRRIGRLCGPGALDIRMLDDSLQAVTWQRHGDLLGRRRPHPAAPLLVLGDLGCYGGERDRERWEATARRLRRDGLRVAALVPCSPLDPRWDRALARAWSAMPWERSALSSHALTADERVHRLLRLIAPTFLAQPGLVRALRRLLPAAEADASTEVDVWHHPDVAAKDVTGLVLKPGTSERLRAEFASLPRSLQADVAALIERWHRELPPELLHAETLAWRSWSTTEPPGDLERAKTFARRVTVTGWTEGGDDAEPGLARDYGRYLLGAVGDALYQEEPALKKLWSVTRAQLPGERRPATIAAHEVVKPGPRQAARWWGLCQRGDALIVVPAVTGAWPGPGPGSPVATFAAAEPTVWVRRGDKRDLRPTTLDKGVAIRLQPSERLVLDTDQGGEIALAVWQRAAWAVAVGRDRYGLWAAFEVSGVQQRMRWIPPGRFLMGSPPLEAGRWDDEGPQHEVTITKGYWLGDTPVTQALWRAVMTKNPSQFVGDDRPVEQVSWDDCQTFVGRLNQRLEGLEARLPTEAEWERACRSGTTTATWVGDLTLRGENDAPELDAIAWYGGNGGVVSETDDHWNSWSSIEWREKQYPHTQAGTHPVGRKAPNPYGLNDMLGNVFEWCQDAADGIRAPSYVFEPAVDPVSRGQGPHRVARGGSFLDSARVMRAALRFAYPRDSRVGRVGFRVAGDQVSAPGKPNRPERKSRSGDPRRGAGRNTPQVSEREGATQRRDPKMPVRRKLTKPKRAKKKGA
jgi:formylglycine-generating enzyme required for sulfatase activity